MPQATVEVQYVNPPKEGFSSGSIKCLFPNGKADYIEVHEDMLSDFVKGGTYTVFYIEKTRRTTGKPYKQFQELVSQPIDAKHDAVPIRSPLPPHGPVTAPQKPAGEVFQRPSQEMGMFVMGCVGRAMGSGCFTADNIYELTVAARAAWEQIMEGKAPVGGVQRPPMRPPSDAVRNSPLARASVTPGGIPEADFLRDDPPAPDPAAYGATRD